MAADHVLGRLPAGSVLPPERRHLGASRKNRRQRLQLLAWQAGSAGGSPVDEKYRFVIPLLQGHCSPENSTKVCVCVYVSE